MKKLLSCMVLAVVFVAGCTKEVKVTTTSDVKVEYGAELDNAMLFDKDASDDNVSVKSVDGFDSKKVGEQTLQVTFTDGKTEVEKEVKVIVEDTQSPEITLKKDKVSITEGDKVTLKDNVKEVKDPVDGELAYSEKEVEKDGYYIDEGKLDTSKAGTYDVSVIAKDANANESKKSFQVEVKEKEEEKTVEESTVAQQSSQQSSSTTTSSNTNSSTNSSTQSSSNTTQSTTPSQSQPSSSTSNNASNNTISNNTQASQPVESTQPVQEETQECVFNGEFGAVGNSGKVFYSYDEAMNYGWEQSGPNGEWGQKGWTGFYMWTVYDNCGERNDVWTVDFYETKS